MPHQCRNCKHIFAEPLTKDPKGEPLPPRFSCYWGPPQIVWTPQGILVAHPTVVPGKPACGQFKIPITVTSALPPAPKAAT